MALRNVLFGIRHFRCIPPNIHLFHADQSSMKRVWDISWVLAMMWGHHLVYHPPLFQQPRLRPNRNGINQCIKNLNYLYDLWTFVSEVERELRWIQARMMSLPESIVRFSLLLSANNVSGFIIITPMGISLFISPGSHIKLVFSLPFYRWGNWDPNSSKYFSTWPTPKACKWEVWS